MSFVQYQNIIIFAEKWRKFTPDFKPLTEEEFKTQIQINQRIEFKYINENTGRRVNIYLFSEKSKYAISSSDLRTLLEKIKDPTDIILISKDPFKIYGNRVINKIKNLRIKTYLHENFSILLPNGPLCYPHRILTHEEVDQLLNKWLYCKLINLPKIQVNDPMCKWIGAEIGDVVAIDMPSDISCETEHYRVVIPSGGKNVSFKAIDNPEEPEPIDEYIAEHLEDNIEDNDDNNDNIDNNDNEAETESVAL